MDIVKIASTTNRPCKKKKLMKYVLPIKIASNHQRCQSSDVCSRDGRSQTGLLLSFRLRIRIQFVRASRKELKKLSSGKR